MSDSDDPAFKLRELGRAGPVAIIAALLPAIGGFVLLGSLPVVGPAIRDLGAIGILLYVLVFSLTSGFAVLPTYAQAALGGWAFGPVVGSFAALGGLLGGSLIGYIASRTVAGDDAIQPIKSRPLWNAVYESFVNRSPTIEGRTRTLGIITLIRIPPNSPFALTNLLMASARVPLPLFVIGTAVGMLPRTALVAWIGSTVESLTTDSLNEAKPGWFLAVAIGLSLLVLYVLAQLGHRAIKKVVQVETPSSDEPPQNA